MVREARVRELALALPEAVEQDHHGFPSFRVRGKIFATVPDTGTLNLMIDLDEVAAVVALFPSFCTELRWGKKLSGVQVELAHADAKSVTRLLASAWEHK